MRSAKKAVLAFAMFTLVVTGSGCSTGSSSDSVEDYPSDEIRLIVPYTPGGPTDLVARTIGRHFEQTLGQPVVVENLPGAAGSVAMNELISSKSDGHTLKLIAAPATVVTPLIHDVGYRHDAFETIGVASIMPSVLQVRTDSNFVNAEQFFAEAKAKPRQLKVGVPGATTSQAIELRRLANDYGIELTVIPFNGNTEMIPALMGGNIDALFSNLSKDIRSQFHAGDFRPLAISPPQRVDYLPHVPTLSELGYRSLTYSTSLFGFGVPEGTPPEIVDELERALETALRDSRVRQQLDEAYVPDQFIDGAAFRARLDEIVQIYGPVAEEIGGN